MKEKLIESFSDHVPGISEIGRFSIGFFESRNSAGKRWIVSPEDLEMMYKKFDPGSEIPLWCDGKSDGKKRSNDDGQEAETPLSKREKKETNIDNILLELPLTIFNQTSPKLILRSAKLIAMDHLIYPSLVLHSPINCRRSLQQKLLQMQLWLLLNTFEVHHSPIQVVQVSIPVQTLASLQEKKLSFGKNILISSKIFRNSVMMQP